MIYSVLIVPVAATVITLILYHNKVKWWEAALPWIAAVITIVVSKGIAEYSVTRDSEFWGGWTVSAHYYEDWNEYIHKTCTKCVSRDKKGNCTYTQSYDCSYVDYHHEYWQLRDSNGQTHNVPENFYKAAVRKFAMTPQFVDMRRNYHTNDGDMYQVKWDGKDSTLLPVFTSHTYENRVAVSRSVFSYRDITDEEATNRGLFKYPSNVDLLGFPSVLGNCGRATSETNDRLKLHNAKLGRAKQLRMWMLCTDVQDPSFGQDQESLWKGGNKNEVVLVKGDGWIHIFSWTDDKTPLIETRDFVATQKEFDPVATVDFMASKMKSGFVRKEFADFSYLTVETSTTCVVVSWILVTLLSVGICVWAVKNEFMEKH